LTYGLGLTDEGHCGYAIDTAMERFIDGRWEWSFQQAMDRSAMATLLPICTQPWWVREDQRGHSLIDGCVAEKAESASTQMTHFTPCDRIRPPSSPKSRV